MKEQKTYTVFSRRVAYALHDMGFRWLSIEPSRTNQGYNVYIFPDTPELREVIYSKSYDKK